jgi:hypothetical protein
MPKHRKLKESVQEILRKKPNWGRIA